MTSDLFHISIFKFTEPVAGPRFSDPFVFSVSSLCQILTGQEKYARTLALIVCYFTFHCVVFGQMSQFIIPCLLKMQTNLDILLNRSQIFFVQIKKLFYHGGHPFSWFKSCCFSHRLLISQFIVSIQKNFLQMWRKFHKFSIVRTTLIPLLLYNNRFILAIISINFNFWFKLAINFEHIFHSTYNISATCDVLSSRWTDFRITIWIISSDCTSYQAHNYNKYNSSR